MFAMSLTLRKSSLHCKVPFLAKLCSVRYRYMHFHTRFFSARNFSLLCNFTAKKHVKCLLPCKEPIPAWYLSLQGTHPCKVPLSARYPCQVPLPGTLPCTLSCKEIFMEDPFSLQGPFFASYIYNCVIFIRYKTIRYKLPQTVHFN